MLGFTQPTIESDRFRVADAISPQKQINPVSLRVSVSSPRYQLETGFHS
nr:hypothetical protein [Arthrospira sp. PLM2.Bin9]